MLKILLIKDKLFKFSKTVKCIPCAYSTSTSPKVITENEEIKQQLKEYDRISQMTSKRKLKNPQKEPFIKNLFLGVFDTDILTYPQLDNEELQNLESKVQIVKSVVEENNCDVLSKNLLKKLGEHQLLGLECSQVLGGRELTLTDASRFFEHLFDHNMKYNLLENEQFGINALNKFGNERQIKLYLEPLIKGELLSAFGVLENNASDQQNLNTKATFNELNKSWVINGEKNWVINGNSADFFIILAQTGTIRRAPNVNEPKLTAFIIDSNTSGISKTKCKVADSNELEYTDIIFNNCIVPEVNVLGEIDNGKKILQNLSVNYHLACGPASTNTTKKVLNNFVDYCLNSPSVLNIHETDAIADFVGETLTSIYVMESMTYLTAGLLDQYENQDCDLEATITKIFSTEHAKKATSRCRDIIGPSALLENHWCDKLHKDAINQSLCHETNNNLKMILALKGLQFAGVKLNDTVKMIRNPLFYSAFMFKRMITGRRHANDDPKLTLNLNFCLHPSLFTPSQQLEYCVLRLQFVTEAMLSREGNEIINKHIDQQRLADAVIDIYAMVAALGRASRSYCIGLQHANVEMLIASSFCMNAMERVKTNINKILSGPYETTDESYRKISSQLFKSKEYFPVHPLTRNF